MGLGAALATAPAQSLGRVPTVYLGAPAAESLARTMVRPRVRCAMWGVCAEALMHALPDSSFRSTGKASIVATPLATVVRQETAIVHPAAVNAFARAPAGGFR